MAKRKSFLGIDIGHYYTKIVDISEKDNIRFLNSAIKERTPDALFTDENIDEEILKEFIKDIVSTHKIKNKKTAIALNSSVVIAKMVDMPLVDTKEMEQSVMWEAKQYIPFNLDTVNVSYQIMKKDEDAKEMQVLIAAVKKDKINSYVNAIKNAGLQVLVADVDVFSEANIFYSNNENVVNDSNLIIDVGYDATKMLFMQGEIPAFSRYVDFGFKTITDSISRNLEISFDKANSMMNDVNSLSEDLKIRVLSIVHDEMQNLYDETKNSIIFYRTNVKSAVSDSIKRIVLSGAAGCLIDHIKEDFLSSVGDIKDIVSINPFQLLTAQSGDFDLNDISDSAALYSVATGLAMRGL